MGNNCSIALPGSRSDLLHGRLTLAWRHVPHREARAWTTLSRAMGNSWDDSRFNFNLRLVLLELPMALPMTPKGNPCLGADRRKARPEHRRTRRPWNQACRTARTGYPSCET